MNVMLDWLESVAASDSRVRAVLRRSLAITPGTDVASLPYVERFIGQSASAWHRKAHYLVAGLWAMHWRADRVGAPLSIGEAAARYRDRTESRSVESHLMRVLDADEGQLPHRLRQLVSLLLQERLDFPDLLRGLIYWNDDHRRTQIRWARQFYAVPDAGATPTTLNGEAVA